MPRDDADEELYLRLSRTVYRWTLRSRRERRSDLYLSTWPRSELQWELFVEEFYRSVAASDRIWLCIFSHVSFHHYLVSMVGERRVLRSSCDLLSSVCSLGMVSLFVLGPTSTRIFRMAIVLSIAISRIAWVLAIHFSSLTKNIILINSSKRSHFKHSLT